jgi:hypothetical protein
MGRIELADRKWADATLSASWTADQPCACPPGCVGQGGIHDLDEFLVPGWEYGKHNPSVVFSTKTLYWRHFRLLHQAGIAALF